ncbi:hypothetical protein [Polymorphospora lycopeni]|uniref:XRE family transcriptional regulator n=1 Tax=Polymorphospora lycopeni TaxID=3140240 RepID=A0ABV5CYK4_9ACTN
MNKTDFARTLGITLRSVTNWENGAPLAPFSESMLDSYLTTVSGDVLERYCANLHRLNPKQSRSPIDDETPSPRDTINDLAQRSGPPVTIGATIGQLRRQLDTSLTANGVDDSSVEQWQAIADSYGRTYRTTPTLDFLTRITQDMAGLRTAIDQWCTEAQRRDLLRPAAQMAGLLATSLVNLADHRESRSWFQTARRAAQECHDATLEAWIIVRHAVSALYWDDAHGALALTGQAIALTATTPCIASAWAPAVQARAYSRLGPSRREDTRAAIDRAEIAYEDFAAGHGEQHAYGYTIAQLHFYRSNALTEIGDTATAYGAQGAALTYYEPKASLDSTLVRMDRAFCLSKDGEHEEAARFATQTPKALSPESGPHRHPTGQRIRLGTAASMSKPCPGPRTGRRATRINERWRRLRR